MMVIGYNDFGGISYNFFDRNLLSLFTTTLVCYYSKKSFYHWLVIDCNMENLELLIHESEKYK